MSYVTGSHQFETGIQGLIGFHTDGGGVRRTPASLAAFQGTAVRLNNGVPNQLTLYIAPSQSRFPDPDDRGGLRRISGRSTG